MGMYYCRGCDHYHDSKGDAGYNITNDREEYCDDTLPEFDPEKAHADLQAWIASRPVLMVSGVV